MKIKRKQKIDGIEFIVESHFKNENAPSVRDTLKKIMVSEANKKVADNEKSKVTPTHTINK